MQEISSMVDKHGCLICINISRSISDITVICSMFGNVQPHAKCTKKRLVAGLCPDPLGEFTALPQTIVLPIGCSMSILFLATIILQYRYPNTKY